MVKPKAKPRRQSESAISIRLPLDLQKQAKEKSERTGVPVSFVVRRALEAWVQAKDTYVLPYDPDTDK